MRTAFDRPSVQQTKVSVILHKGRIVGKIITGLSKNHSGATTTVNLYGGPIVNEGEVFTSSKTMAGGGLDFAIETRVFAILDVLKQAGAKLNVDAPYSSLLALGYQIQDIL